mgnify:CR=1 FL=1
MARENFYQLLKKELLRLDESGTSKRFEHFIDDFNSDPSPKAMIGGLPYSVFNSNDYLGLRHHPSLKSAEHAASLKLGTGPGAVRFISGSFAVHRQLEKRLAKFHGREDAIIYSSAFAANLAVIFSLIRGQSKDSVIGNNVLVISDELNHRSIIDGVRLPNLGKEEKAIFKHLDADSLEEILKSHVGKFHRVVVITDGVFSMLGEYQDLQKIRTVINRYDQQYPEGILLIVDDCHGVGAFGSTGRGCEEVSGAKADVLVGTLGKGFGADGGYAVGDQTVIDYLRESSATYIYSNSIAPGCAAAALAAVDLLDSSDGVILLRKLKDNITELKTQLNKKGFQLAAESSHPIQPVLIGDSLQTKALVKKMFEKGFLISSINYPVVPKGRDEIRVQLSASHTREDITAFANALFESAHDLAII